MEWWSSDAATINYRHDEDVIKTVAAAFQFVANPTNASVGGGKLLGLIDYKLLMTSSSWR